MSAIRAICGLLLLAACVEAVEVSPMDKVFQLMDELTAKITKEGEVEDKAYKEFVDWCDDAASETHFTIKTATKKKEELEATIGKATADSEAASTRVEELASAIATAEADLKAATEIRGKEAAEFAKVDAELVTGVQELEGAIAKVSASSAAFVQQQMDTSSVQALLTTLDIALTHASVATASKEKLLAMAQTQQSDSDSDMDTELSAPAGAAYGSHSGGITEILEGMKEKAETELSDARKSENKAKHAFSMLKTGLENQLLADKKEMSEQKATGSDADQTKATASGDLGQTAEELKGSSSHLDTLSTDCMNSASDHETSVKARAEELAVIAEAKKIVKEATGGAAAFLQVTARSKLQASVQLRNTEVVAALKKLAKQHHSTALAQLASRVNAVARYGGGSQNDVFAKIKGLISDMIAKLQKEASEEASKKAYCDEEMAKTKAKHEELTSDIEKLTSKIDADVAASAELKEDVAALQADLADLQKQQQEMDVARTDEHEAYAEAKGDLEKGINGVQQALEVLREYYGSASLIQDEKFDSFMQQPKPPAGHSKSGGAGGSIISILEVCESDFSKTLAEEESAESTAQEEYDKVTQENKVAKVTKEQDVKYKTAEFKGLDKSVAELSGDKSGFESELSAVNEYQGKIDEQCIAKAESYEETKAKREDEIAGLKEALSVLESEAAFLQRNRHLRRVSAH